MISETESAGHQDAAGSPEEGEPVFLAVGRLGRPHGVGGEIVMTVLTDFPERLHPGIVVFVGPDRQPMRIIRRRWHGKRLLLRMEGFTTREEVAALRSLVVAVRADDRPELPPGEYYHHQVLGLQIISDEGQPLGRLAEIIETGANDVYVVRNESGAEILLPAIDEVILNIDLVRGEIQVHLLPGLLAE